MKLLSNILKELEIPNIDIKDMEKKIKDNEMYKKAYKISKKIKDSEKIKNLRKSPKEKRNEMIIDALKKKKVLNKAEKLKKDLEDKIRFK